MRVRLTQEASDDLNGIAEYLLERNADAAWLIVTELERCCFDLLRDHPEAGPRLSFAPNVRGFVKSGYRICYQVGEDELMVIAFVHDPR